MSAIGSAPDMAPAPPRCRARPVSFLDHGFRLRCGRIRFDPSTIGHSSVAVHAARPFWTGDASCRTGPGYQPRPSLSLDRTMIITEIPFHFMRYFPAEGSDSDGTRIVSKNDPTILVDPCLHRSSLTLLFPPLGQPPFSKTPATPPRGSVTAWDGPSRASLHSMPSGYAAGAKRGKAWGWRLLSASGARRQLALGARRDGGLASHRRQCPTAGRTGCNVRRSRVGNLRGIWGAWGEGGGCGRGHGLFLFTGRCVMFSSLHGLHLSGRAHSGSSYGLARAGWAAKEGVMCRRCNQQQGAQRSSRLARCAPYKRKKCGSMAPVESRLRELLDVEYSGAQSTGTWSCVVQPLPGPYLTRRGRYLIVAAGDSQAEGTDDHESSPEVGVAFS